VGLRRAGLQHCSTYPWGSKTGRLKIKVSGASSYNAEKLRGRSAPHKPPPSAPISHRQWARHSRTAGPAAEGFLGESPPLRPLTGATCTPISTTEMTGSTSRRPNPRTMARRSHSRAPVDGDADADADADMGISVMARPDILVEVGSRQKLPHFLFECSNLGLHTKRSH